MTRGPGRHSERNFRAAEQHYNAAEWPTCGKCVCSIQFQSFFHLPTKIYQNWWKFDKVLTKTKMLPFETRCSNSCLSISNKEKNEVSSFTCATVTVMVRSHCLISMWRDPGHALFGGHSSSIIWYFQWPIKQKTKCLASSVQQLWSGSQILKSRSHDVGHAPFGGHSSSTK